MDRTAVARPAPGPGPRRVPRAVVLAAVLALTAAACTSPGSGSGSSGGTTVALPQVASSPGEDAPSALRDGDDPRLPPPLVDLREIRSGGPPPDGIPPIDEPRFQRASDVGWLRDREPVMVLGIAGEVRAYPVQIMTWHEIVNDTVAGVPVAVTYCPLCNSAIAYDRRAGARVLDFGTSGRLYRSALVMYDRQTESLWAHFTGQAVAGVLTGTELRTFPLATVAWGDFQAAHPGAWVLSRDTGHSRPYGTNPYPGYDDVGTSPFLFDGRVDRRLAAKERVVGIRQGGAAVAVVLDDLARDLVVEVSVGGRPVTVWHKPGTASALDSRSLADGRDVGATGVFDPVLDGRTLRFTARDGSFVDGETGTRWDILGRATEGPLAGAQLAAVEHVDTFWFAWAAYLPATRLVPEARG